MEAMGSRDDRSARPDDEEPEPTRRGDTGAQRATTKIRIGDELAGKYRVESLLGSGGMGTVLRAFQPELNRHVAIKVMHGELLAMEGAAKRFSLEARATAALKSKHAVRILDIDRLPSGLPFIVMEFLDGKDLATLVTDEGPLSVERATHYLLQATDAVGEAHERGIVHRDLKPQNIIFTEEGVVKVVDFGLAKALRSPGSDGAADSSNTKTNMLVGSPHYMSPEQMRSPRDVDERTDIWALGATYYHLLTGVPPFVATSLQLLSARIATEPVTPVSKRRADAPPSVDNVLRRCLEKEPQMRFLTVAELQLALEDVMSDVNAARTIRQPKPHAIAERNSSYPATTRRGLPNIDTAETEAQTAPNPAVGTLAPSVAPPTRPDTERHPGHTEPPPAVRSAPGSADDEDATVSSAVQSAALTERLTKRGEDD